MLVPLPSTCNPIVSSLNFEAETPILGGANGIGAATVRLLYEVGASVVFGDLATKAAEALLSSLSNPPTITFLPTDVTKYADNIALFKTALQKYGSVE
jgi:NAD(P)-dependent dehydrogenase (short-subunit alcohol dehydrogenase family)